MSFGEQSDEIVQSSNDDVCKESLISHPQWKHENILYKHTANSTYGIYGYNFFQNLLNNNAEKGF